MVGIKSKKAKPVPMWATKPVPSIEDLSTQQKRVSQERYANAMAAYY